MLQQAGGLRRDPPLGPGQRPPAVHFLPQTVDEGGMAVMLRLGGEIVKQERPLPGLLFRLGNGRDELGGTPAFKDFLGRLTGFVQFPMAGRVFVG